METGNYVIHETPREHVKLTGHKTAAGGNPACYKLNSGLDFALQEALQVAFGCEIPMLPTRL
jgi:hypothetical protein